MNKLVKGIVVAARPIHWIKNFALFAAVFLTGGLFNEFLFAKVVVAFASFSLATSATYIFNDIMDAPQDRDHPIKRFRPIAAGTLPITIAVIELVVFFLASLFLALEVGILFVLLLLGYLIMQVFYSMGLKNLHVIDILIIATGFIIRVYAGAFVIDAHLSVWFLLCVISASLFLAAGKRRAELNLTENSTKTRPSLGKYRPDLLNSYVTMFANATWMSWALYTFFESPQVNTDFWLVLAEVSRAATINKLMMLTIPLVIFGIMRYESLIFEDRAEAPEKVLLTDKALIISIGLWVMLVYWILYSGVAVTGAVQ
jgi:4-hydroxybenzoate polyprenyltransferase